MKKKKIKLIVAIIVVLFVIVGSIFGFILYLKSNIKPTNEFLNGEICGEQSSPCEFTTFTVDNGAYGKTTIQKLQNEKIIKDATTAYYWNRLIGNYSFYAGTYNIPHTFNGLPATLDDIFNFISNPDNAYQETVWVELREGDFARTYAESIAMNVVLEDCPDANIEEATQKIISYWDSTITIDKLKNKYEFITDDLDSNQLKIKLEGYLFPDTYEFFKHSSIEDITYKILDRTNDIYNAYKSKFDSSDLSIHEIFTLASIVQWETGDPEDSLLVAGSLLNRIDNPEHEGTSGRLQSTVTACYAFNLSKEECDAYGDTSEYTEQENNYNTYTIEGLPPGPICNPNEISINAALNPDKEAGYYFFVANMCDGGTKFATTLSEHNYNIDTYYLPCAE